MTDLGEGLRDPGHMVSTYDLMFHFLTLEPYNL